MSMKLTIPFLIDSRLLALPLPFHIPYSDWHEPDITHRNTRRLTTCSTELSPLWASSTDHLATVLSDTLKVSAINTTSFRRPPNHSIDFHETKFKLLKFLVVYFCIMCIIVCVHVWFNNYKLTLESVE